MANVPVEFRFQSDVPGAQFEPSVVATDDTGFASVTVVLGATPGAQTVEAVVGASPPSSLLATFGVTAVAAKNGGGGGNGRPESRAKAAATATTRMMIECNDLHGCQSQGP